MDIPTILIKITGAILLFITIRSFISHLREAISARKKDKSDQLSPVEQVLCNIEHVMDFISGNIITFTGIKFLLKILLSILERIDGIIISNAEKIKNTFALFAKYTGFELLFKILNSIVNTFKLKKEPQQSSAETKEPSQISLWTEKALNTLLLYVWLIFMLVFSTGMIVNN